MGDIGTVSNIAGIASFAFLALLLLRGWRRLLSSLSLIACLFSILLFGALALWPQSDASAAFENFRFLEALRDGAWFSFLAGLLLQGRGANWPRMLLVLCVPLVLVVAVRPGLETAASMIGIELHTRYLAFLVLSISGLVLVEMIFRNAPAGSRWAIKFLCFGVGGIFAYDFYMYADALLLRDINFNLWQARGAINALTVPLIAIAAARNRHWGLDIFVSRQVVFHSTAVVVAGVYLLIMAGAGYYIRYYGGSWGGALQSLFLFGAVLVLIVLFFSGQLRARLMVFLAKHFFANKYDYREEWLRFTHTLAQCSGDSHSTHETIIKAIAEIMQSNGGLLWLADETGTYRQVASYHLPRKDDVVFPAGSSLALFLGRSGWVVNLHEYRREPERYPELAQGEWLEQMEGIWLLVPLMLQDKLLGFLGLAPSRVPVSFNWEDSDLLKTVGRQTASYLALMQVSDSLAQARQFEAFNRLSAFVVHDLKNVVAQLSLIGSNANRHMDNPDFVRDAFQTVSNAVEKMNRMLGHLRKTRVAGESSEKIDLAEAITTVVELRSHARPVPRVQVTEEPLVVRGERDRVVSVLEHLVQNAQEATPAEGRVDVMVRRNGEQAVLEVRDTGCGMDAEFIRLRLFRPFDTTKGNAGMGIGVFESREVIRGLGGEISVESIPGSGTVFTVTLPLSKTDKQDAVQPVLQS